MYWILSHSFGAARQIWNRKPGVMEAEDYERGMRRGEGKEERVERVVADLEI